MASPSADSEHNSILIRPAEAGDEQNWRRLWSGYCAFYGADVPERVTAATWRRILEPGEPIAALVADVAGRVDGMANYVLHEFTWSDRPTCLLEDLYVAREARGRGIGRRLIEEVIALAHAEQWARLYWHTRADNHAARALYDSFVTADGFVRYTVHLQGAQSQRLQ